MAESEVIDLFVIGGGINGAGVARDAAGRGLSVVLCEKDDLAEGTSSRSGKLVHGGLRYLEYYEFRLVREALIEREVLLRAAPHIIWPMRFVLPHSPQDRPAWLVRLGLFMYDHLGGRKRGCRERARSTCDARPRGHSAARSIHARFRVFGLLGGRFAAGCSQRRRCGGARRARADAVAGRLRAARGRRLDRGDAQRQRALSAPFARAVSSTRRGRGSATSSRAWLAPIRRATFGSSRAATSSSRNSGRARTPISSRTTTSA